MTVLLEANNSQNDKILSREHKIYDKRKCGNERPEETNLYSV